MEHLTVIVFGKHTLSVGLGEEAEIVGDIFVLESGIASRRFGSRVNLRNVGDSGRLEVAFYAKRIKYTNRQQELDLKDKDIEIIKRLAANYPQKKKPKGLKIKRSNDIISVLSNLVAPRIYDKTGGVAKKSLLFTLVGAAPKHPQNYYGDRHWINTIFPGDKGTGKTTMMKDGINEIQGSQLIDAQHATGKGAVAIAERGSSGEAVLRIGPVALANGSVCGIDEFQLFELDDQSQFLAIMQSGVIYYNKMGIHQIIRAHTGIICTANPEAGNWKDAAKISLGEVAIKEQLWDRQDYFAIFKKDKNDEERNKFSEIKELLSRVQLRPGHSLLKKCIHYIVTNPELQETSFSDSRQVTKLRLFWNRLSRKYHEIMGPRSYETVYRTASVIARIMLKVEVDSEVVQETIEFLTQMYVQLDEIKTERVDLISLTFETMREIIKEHSQKKSWAEEQERQRLEKLKSKSKSAAPQLLDITFNQAAEIACTKDHNIAGYLGEHYKDRNYRATRNLRAMFREKQHEVYDNGRVQVVSKANQELVLRWVPILP
jgi:DNA replicative helicase MCM subunit Mcm2 (Cdc46/Mcm family)